jgi:CRP/FNR family transcriptional regulator
MIKRKDQAHVDCHHCDSRFKSVFCDLASEELEALNNHKSCSQIKKGQVIFNEGFHPHGIYCVNSGKIKVSQMGDAGREHIVRLAKDGDILGYRAVLSGDKYSCSAIALDDCNICFVPKEVFLGMVQRDVSLSMSMMRLLSDNLKQAETRITEMAQKPVRERLAESILFLKETYGYETGTNILNVTMSREELANMTGTATETAIRLLSELKSDGIIELTGKKIGILDHSKLVPTANLFD